MNRYVSLVGGLMMCLGASTALHAQGLRGSKKIMLQRMLPPVVELDARTFGIDATSQVQTGDAPALAASFKESFRAKIQGDERFVYSAYNPALRITIVITRYYVEAKQLTRPDARTAPCTTYTGTLQGTFQVVEVTTGRPLASDTIGWSLQTGATKQWLVSADGQQSLNLKGPNEKLTVNDAWRVFEPDSPVQRKLGVPFLGGKPPHPCDLPLTQNEARDVLADAFMTEIIQMAVPYRVAVEVPVFSNKAIARAAEDARAGEWSKALDGALAVKPLPDAEDEGQRLYLIGLAYEALGYRDGQRAFDVNKQIQAKLAADEMARLQTELRRIVDLTKEQFDNASTHYNQANLKKNEEDYRQGERRAEQSRRLYARIQKYRDLKPETVAPATTEKLRMPEVLAMCAQGIDETIIVYTIEQTPELDIKPSEFGELAQCGPRQKAIFQAIVQKRKTAKATTPEAPVKGAPPAKPPAKTPTEKATEKAPVKPAKKPVDPVSPGV